MYSENKYDVNTWTNWKHSNSHVSDSLNQLILVAIIEFLRLEKLSSCTSEFILRRDLIPMICCKSLWSYWRLKAEWLTSISERWTKFEVKRNIIFTMKSNEMLRSENANNIITTWVLHLNDTNQLLPIALRSSSILTFTRQFKAFSKSNSAAAFRCSSLMNNK